MGLFDDLLAKATELTGLGQDAADTASQAADEATSQIQDLTSNVTEQLPDSPQDVANQLFGDQNQEK